MKTTHELFSTPSSQFISHFALSGELSKLRHAIEQIRLCGESVIQNPDLFPDQRTRVNRFLQFVFEVTDEIRNYKPEKIQSELGDKAAVWAIELSLITSGTSIGRIDQNLQSLVNCFTEACMLLGRLEESIQSDSKEVDDYRALYCASVDYIISEARADQFKMAA